jgi:uncharacterized protein involved in exopolysaccharide biosynthesis
MMTQPETLLASDRFTNESTASRPRASLVDILAILKKRKRFVFWPAFILSIMAAIYAHGMRDSFTAVAVILPPQQQQSSLAAFASGAMGGVGGPGISLPFGLRSPADLYIGILKSETISDDMIDRFHLKEVYKAKLLSAARRALHARSAFTSGKDSLLSISVTDQDPKRAAAMANAFIDELHKQNSRLAITDAAQRRLFFQQRLSKEKDDLTDSEIALKNTQTATGLVAPAGQSEALIRSVAQLRAEISMREVSLQGIRSYATDDNAQVQVLKREISTMQAQLTQLEGKGQSSSTLEVPAGALPTASLAFLRKVRDVKYHEMLSEMLSRQYEAALMDEARQAPVIQVVDAASVPDEPSGPRRMRIVLVSALAGMVLASLFAVVDYEVRALSQVSRAI